MPLNGNKSNIANLSAYVLQKFQLANLIPQNLIVCGAGIENHEEFLELVQSELGSLTAGKERVRENSKYLGGEVRSLKESNEINLALAWKGVNKENYNYYRFSDCLFKRINLIYSIGELG
jgi:predicted Zn-dependent peptidase